MMTRTDNELIAEYYGAEFTRRPDPFYEGKFIEQWIIKGNPYNQHRDPETKYHYSKDMMHYHSSMDWLWPVVMKIQQEPKTHIKIENGQCLITVDGSVQGGAFDKDGRTFECIYVAVVNYIKWRNSNSQ